MTNNGEIRRVLGKSQKNTTSNQKELEVKKKVEEKSSANNDAVAELTENNGKQSLRMTVHVKIIRSQAVLPTQLLILFKASPRNSDGAIAQSDFSSDETKIRRP